MPLINPPGNPALIDFQNNIQEIFTCTLCNKMPSQAQDCLHTLGHQTKNYYHHKCLEDLYAYPPVHHPASTTQNITALKRVYLTHDFLAMAAFRRFVREDVVQPQPLPLLSVVGAPPNTPVPSEAASLLPSSDLPPYYEAIATGTTPLDFANLLLEPGDRPAEERILVCPVMCPDGQTRNLHTVCNEIRAGKTYPYYHFIFNGATTRLLKIIWDDAVLLWPGDAKATWRAAGENIGRTYYNSREQLKHYLAFIESKSSYCLGQLAEKASAPLGVLGIVGGPWGLLLGSVSLCTGDGLAMPCCIIGGTLCGSGLLGLRAMRYADSYTARRLLRPDYSAMLDDIYRNFIILRAEITVQQPRRLSATTV